MSGETLYAILPPAIHGHTRHLEGLPPQFTDGVDLRTSMPPTRFLIVQETAEGLFLIRHSLDGEYAGDTWHEDLANLKKQVQFEFECAIDWASFPYGVADPIEFVREKVDKSADRRGGAA